MKLEMLGRDNDVEAIIAETPVFLKPLKVFVEELTPKEQTDDDDAAPDDLQYLADMLLKIKAACDDYDESAADYVLTELKKAAWSRQTRDFLAKIDEQLLHCDFDDISRDISEFTEKLV